MAESNPKADALKAEGEKALTRMTLFGFGKSQKYEDAAECFSKAGNAYKLSKLWQSAGEVYLQAAEALLQADAMQTDATNAYIEAANCFKKINPLDAVNAYEKAIQLYNDNGRLGMSARYAKEMAEVYEADNNLDGAMASYQQAADLFLADNKKSNGNSCLVKVATFASSKGEYLRAADIFEQIAKDSLESRLGSYSAKGYFTQCILCHLAAGDQVQVANKINMVKNTDFSFSTSRECEFMEKLLKASENLDAEEYSQACSDYDRISPLDQWKTSILLKGKKHITDAAGDGEVDLS